MTSVGSAIFCMVLADTKIGFYQNEEIDRKMYTRVYESCDYQTDEVPVVFASDTVVQPHAMMVKIHSTPVTFSAVFRTFQYMSITPLTKSLVFILRKRFVLFPVQPFVTNNKVRRVNVSSDNGKIENKQIENPKSDHCYECVIEPMVSFLDYYSQLRDHYHPLLHKIESKVEPCYNLLLAEGPCESVQVAIFHQLLFVAFYVHCLLQIDFTSFLV